MTFNSDDEKRVIQQFYSQYPQHTITELVPEARDGQWFQKVCSSGVKCDALVISGHFGGLFFGEKKIPTLSMQEMFEASCNGSCRGVFENVKSVYLMGCNTLATKKKDHRSIEQYLNVLVNDGFPLEHAERVAASRYANFGESIENKMKMIFPQAEVIFGFDSTGPLGTQAAPLVMRALQQSSTQDIHRIGISPNALTNAFKGKNIRITQADAQTHALRGLRCNAVSAHPSYDTMAQLFNRKQSKNNYDVIFELKNKQNLTHYLINNPDDSIQFHKNSYSILNETQSMLGIQKSINDLLHEVGYMDNNEYVRTSTSLIDRHINKLNYIKTEQICDMAQRSPNLPASPHWSLPYPGTDSFKSVINLCFQYRTHAFKSFQINQSQPLGSCLARAGHAGDDWNCLNSNSHSLDLESCLASAQRNPAPENGDDMRWFCWDRLKEQRRINQAQCLVLSKSMNSLGNRIKSNWNCLNQLK